jgi:hypothetical protein
MPACPSDKDSMRVKILEWQWKTDDRDGGILYFPLVWIMFKDPVRTSKRTPHFTVTKISWLTLFNPLKPKLV